MSWWRENPGQWLHMKVPRPAFGGYGWLCAFFFSIAIFLWGVAAFWQVSLTAQEDPWIAAIRISSHFRFFIVGISVIGSCYFFRRFRISRRMINPGPISVPTFSSEGEDPGIEAERLTTHFREALAEVSLEAPSPMPGGSQQIDFVEVLNSPTLDSGTSPASLMAALGRLLSLTHVSYSYQVNGVLYRSPEGTCSVTVQVIVLPKWASQSITCTAPTFEAAVKSAAYEVCAFILPLTRLVEKPPWSAWHGLAIPHGLFRDVQEAQKCKFSRRYDEALGKYFEAIAQDPHNPFLRLEVGFIQEQLGLCLDALMTYQDIIKLGLNRDVERLAWIRGTPAYFRKIGVRKNWWRAALLTARYRQAILLGMGEQLIDDWCSCNRRPIGKSKRDAELRRLQNRILQMFEEYESGFAEHLRDHGDKAGAEGKDGIRELLVRNFTKTPKGRDGKLLVQEFFQFVGQVKAQDLRRAYRFRRIPGGTVSRVALRLMLVWTPARRCWTRAARRKSGVCEELSELKYSRVYVGSCLARPRKSTAQVLVRATGREWKWPMSARHIQREISFACFRVVPFRRTPWHDFYYSACIFAIGLLPLPFEKGRSARIEGDEISLAKQAVKYLDRACRRADSSSIASMRSWVVAEDPDLVALRTSSEFAAWEDEHYPLKNPAFLRPVSVHDLELIKYQHDLVKKVAGLMVQIWERRKRDLSNSRLDAGEVQRQWLDEEGSTWRMTRDFAVDQHHWQTRFDFIRAVQEFAQCNSLLFEHSCPSYGDDPVMQLREVRRRHRVSDSSHRKFQQTVLSVHKKRKDRIGELGEFLGGEGGFERRIGLERSETLNREEMRRLCCERSRMWGRLAKAFEEKAGEDSVKVVGDVASVFKGVDQE
ncbi:hypothetical protein ABTX77_14165 [Streptomyces sp. NPDC097704]|uniref:hypothetical protein n=1 Tax=Streptomyces sp. NPDC097704 TaxID=3157101 RepID=UPI00332AEE34